MPKTDIAKLFQNGRSQAVRLPKQFRFEGDRVRIRRVAQGVLLERLILDTARWFEELDQFKSAPFPPRAPTSAGHAQAKDFLVDYLLDTNACIALINGQPATVRARLQKATAGGGHVLVSSVALFELWYGVAKSTRQDFNRKRLETFLAGPILVLPFDDADAHAAGAVRAALEAAGKPIGAYDVLMAGQALHHHLTLVTANVSEFSRVRGLAWQDWARSH